MNFRLTAKLVQQQTSRLFAKACGAARKNYTLVVQPFSIQYGYGATASQAIASFTIPLTQTWGMRNPVSKPSSNFVAVLAYRFGTTVRRYKLWSGIGEVMDFPLYLGETIPAGAKIEIWTVPNKPATLTSVWNLPLALLELPATPCDADGTQIYAEACIAPYPATVAANLTACAY